MLLKHITEEELEFMELWHTPRALIECLFSNFDNLAEFNEGQFSELRLYQYPMISWESFFDFDGMAEHYNLSEKEKFQLKKNVGDIYSFGARKIGKTLLSETLDLLGWTCTSENEEALFASVDMAHITDVLDKVRRALLGHPIVSIFKGSIKGAPRYKFQNRNGTIVESVNFALGSKEPGQQFFGRHSKRMYIEEASLETDEVYNKRQDALSELGAVFRISGMTNFTKHSPAGRTFYEPDNREHIMNLPQFVSPFWDDKEKEDRKKKYGGEESIGYRVFAKGEVIEDGVSEFDIEKIKSACVNEKIDIKRFEIPEKRYPKFRDYIVVERPKNAERIFICADIGEASGTEIIVLSEIGDKYQYLYNIVLYNLTHLEQTPVFKWLASELSANIIAIDCGDGTGRAIFAELEKTVSRDNLVWYDGSKKIDVGFELDKDGKPKLNKGIPITRQEFMSEWSVRRLKILLYEGRCLIPKDYKFEMQFNYVISTPSGTRTLYKCVAPNGDHLFDAFKVFGVAQWLKKDFNQTPPINDEWGTGVCS